MCGDGTRGDEAFMRRALELAARGLGRTSPNPAVGALVVVDGEIVAEGWHRRAGEPHAEVVALEAAGDRARGATMYVSLEPCRHFGRTPPCTEAIIAAGIRRVAYACGDCDERCAGEGARALAEGGVVVSCGPLTQEAQRLNEAYFEHKSTGLPFVTLKMACSLDGKTATRTGDSKWISGEGAREIVHGLRDRVDAVMVGIGTVVADDPRLTTRVLDGGGKDCLRVIVDSAARTPVDANVITIAGAAGCLIAASERADPQAVDALGEAGAEVVVLAADESLPGGGVDLRELMAELGGRGIMSVLLEGGATLAAGAIEAGIVDKLILFCAPVLVGGADAPGVLAGAGVEAIGQAGRVRITEVRRVGEDVMIEAYVCSQG